MTAACSAGALCLGLLACAVPEARSEAPRGEHRAAAAASAPTVRESPGATGATEGGPRSSQAGWLKGQTHVHTVRSYDARTPVDEVLRFYAERGYDFVSLTDHNRVTVAKPPPGLLLVPGIELSQNSASCEPKPAPGYRCLFHTSGLFVDPSRDPAHGERIVMPFRPARLGAYQAQLDQVSALGAVPVLNHPAFHFAADAPTIVELGRRGVRLVELFNASLDRQHPANRDAAERRAEELWDDVLSRGTLIYAMATDDAHHFSDATERRRVGKFAYVGDRAWIMVRAARSPTAIREALLAGRFYATTGVTLSELTPGRALYRLQVEPRAGSAFVTRFVGRSGRELARVPGLAPSYAPRGDEGYVRAVVEGPDGQKAWAQPLVLEGGS